MLRIARTIAMLALTFVGVTSMMGAAPMIMDPSGQLLRLPQSLLEHSPFHTFLIPGIILLAANGAMSLAILVTVVLRTSGYGWWVTFQGCVLAGWITVEVIMIRQVMWAHYLYWGFALILIGTGLKLTRLLKKANS